MLGLIIVGFSAGAGYYAMIEFKPHATSNHAGVAKPTEATSSAAASAVAHFYDRINAKDWPGAFAELSPTFRGAQTIADFEAGYATTKSVDASIEDDGTNSVVTHLTAVDVYPNGSDRTRKFTITWKVVQDESGRRLLDSAKVVTIADSNPRAAEAPADATTVAVADRAEASQSSSQRGGASLDTVSPAVRATLTFVPSENSTQYPDQNIATLVENACGESDFVGSSDLPGSFATSSGPHGSTNVIWTLKSCRNLTPKLSFNISQDGDYLRELDRDTCLVTHDRAFQEAMQSLVSPHQSDTDEPRGRDCNEEY